MKTFTADITQPDEQLVAPQEEARLEDVARFLAWGNGTLAPDANDVGTYGGIRI